jgi:hypothetical protein
MPRATTPKALPKNDRSILLKMPTAVHRKAVRMAGESGLSVSALIRYLLIEEDRRREATR